MTSPTISRSPFGVLPSGTPVELFTLANTHGITLRVMSYGGIVLSLTTPDRYGESDDIVLGYDALDDYLHGAPYFGAIVGRYANRIAGAEFTLDGITYRLSANDGPNALHGGVRGFDKVVWDAEPFEHPSGVGLTMTYVSHDGEEGYPGTLTTRVTYTLMDDDTWCVEYIATSDRPTILNLTQHSYFNLTGGARRDVREHELTIAASRYTPVTTTLIPTGEIVPVSGTPFDFRTATPIGARIDALDEQLRRAGGYDHNFVLDSRREGIPEMLLTSSTLAPVLPQARPPRATLLHAAHVIDPTSGRTLDVYTDQPGVQFYSGNFLDGSIRGKGGVRYGPRSGFCLETQHFPDSPHHPVFPTTILRPGERYHTRTVFAFGVFGNGYI